MPYYHRPISLSEGIAFVILIITFSTYLICETVIQPTDRTGIDLVELDTDIQNGYVMEKLYFYRIFRT